MVPPTSHKVSRVSWYFGYCLSLFVFPYGAFTLSGRLSQYRSGNSEYNLLQSLTLQCTHRSLGSFPFARRYSGNRCFFLFLRVLRCFSSPGSLPYVMDWRMDTWGLLKWVSPFGYLRINGYLLLPEAFRSLSRLSSALSAKASTLRPYYFNRSRNDRISWFSVSSLMYSVTSAGFVFFHFPISLLTMKFEFLWCLDSFPFLKMNSILILVWSFQGTSVFQKQYPVSATLLVLSTMPSKNVYS